MMGTDTGNTKKKEIKNTHTINETATGYEKKTNLASVSSKSAHVWLNGNTVVVSRAATMGCRS
jgi:NOL1/NOP2/fmu family ribosome biogenesis protein